MGTVDVVKPDSGIGAEAVVPLRNAALLELMTAVKMTLDSSLNDMASDMIYTLKPLCLVRYKTERRLFLRYVIIEIACHGHI